MNVAAVLAAAAFVPMLVETARSRRSERILRARGAVEPRGDVYRIMQVAYPAAFAAIVAEAWLREARGGQLFAAGATIFGLGKGLKYWAVHSLGPRWTFRVLVPPGSVPVRSGPYRWLRHPNYAGVIGELTGAALMAEAVVAGPLALVGFGALLWLRIRVEERALAAAVR